MLYNEFVEGTGCRDNDHNYKVYKNLEVMYMNTDMSKAEIYEYGKKLVDNSKSEAELKLEAEIKAEIAEHKNEIERYKRYIDDYANILKWWKEQGDKEMVAMCKNTIKGYKLVIKKHRAQIAALKWVLE